MKTHEDKAKHKIVSVHQPTYFPWIGYFHKIFHSDIFIILDDVQIGSHNLVNRVHIRTPVGKQYIHIPLKHHSIKDSINSVYPVSNAWKENNIGALRHYRKSPYFNKYFPLIEKIIDTCDSTKVISEINTCLIEEICNVLGIKRRIIKSSNIATMSKKAGLMIELTKAVGGNIYFSGAAAKDYQKKEDFDDAGIKLVYQDIYNFIESNPYKQVQGDFINGLSVLDALFNIGAEGIIKLFENYSAILKKSGN